MPAPSTHALVVCESMFGHTRVIADTIADTLSEHVDHVEVVDVAAASTDTTGIDLLVVGAPTHAFGMSRASTRTAAVEQGASAVVERGTREWLDELNRPSAHTPAFAFDTRIPKPFTGSAAKRIARRLRRLGFDVAPAMSFSVRGPHGPLVPGESERARQWATTIAGGIQPQAASR